jgi:hypothetical protein
VKTRFQSLGFQMQLVPLHGGSISKKFGPLAAAKGCFVVDNSSAFRMTPGVPLVIPEVGAAVCESNAADSTILWKARWFQTLEPCVYGTTKTLEPDKKRVFWFFKVCFRTHATCTTATAG